MVRKELKCNEIDKGLLPATFEFFQTTIRFITCVGMSFRHRHVYFVARNTSVCSPVFQVARAHKKRAGWSCIPTPETL